MLSCCGTSVCGGTIDAGIDAAADASDGSRAADAGDAADAADGASLDGGG